MYKIIVILYMLTTVQEDCYAKGKWSDEFQKGFWVSARLLYEPNTNGSNFLWGGGYSYFLVSFSESSFYDGTEFGVHIPTTKAPSARRDGFYLGYGVFERFGFDGLPNDQSDLVEKSWTFSYNYLLLFIAGKYIERNLRETVTVSRGGSKVTFSPEQSYLTFGIGIVIGNPE